MINQLYSSLKGFTFNGVHNHDMGVIMHSKSIQTPSKKKIKESVPFINGNYDFSTVATNGEIVYDSREITIVLGLPCETKEQLQILYSQTLEWLEDVGKSQLIFDDMDDYYYMAEVESSSSFDEIMSFGTLSVTFIADPLKTSVDYVGNDIWDTFNFEEDYAISTNFEVNPTNEINVYNPGRMISPMIVVSTDMTIVCNGKTYDLLSGINNNYHLVLKHGSNIIIIDSGIGTISFMFRKQSL